MIRSFAAELAGERHGAALPILTLAVFAALYLPFLGKAFHIDGPAFLELARHIGWSPLDAEPYTFHYQGHLQRDFVAHRASHPFLVPWLLKILTTLVGTREVALRAAFLVFPLVAVVGLVRTHRNLFPNERRHSAVLAIVFLATPAVLVNAQTLMADVPALAFLLAATACLTDPGRRPRALLAGGVLLGLAGLAAYQYLFLWPLLGLYHARHLRREPWTAAALAIPGLLVGGWLAAVHHRHGFVPLLAPGDGADVGHEVAAGQAPAALAGKLLFDLACLGMSVGFLWIAQLRTDAWRRHLAFLLASVALVALLGAVAPLPEPLAARGLLVGLVFVGLESLVLGVAWLRAAPRQPGVLLLLGWVAAALLYNLWLLPFGSARYLLPALPPLLMLACVALGRSSGRPRGLLPAAVAMAVAFGGVAAVADHRLANHYRAFAREVEHLAAAQGAEAWFIGEWGMRHYFEAAGARYLPARSNAPAPGDLVVIPEMPLFWAPSRRLQARLEPRGVRHVDSGVPLKLFHRESSAGFYSHLWGVLPFAISDASDETFTLYAVVR